MTINLKPDLDEAERFLKAWPGFPVLSASATNPTTGEKGAFITKSFPPPTDWAEVRRWIAARQGGTSGWHNIYFSVNPPLGEQDKKTKRTDIKALVALHIDVDVRPGEDQDKGIARIIKTFEKYRQPPSDIVTSGGGAQAYWRMSVPVPIDGDANVCEDLKLYNVKIESELGGDHCHNVDRVMRVPGTVNIPNETKLAKGRKPALAHWFSTAQNTFDLGQFAKAESVGGASASTTDAAFEDTGDYAKVLPEDERLVGVDRKWIEIGVKGDVDNQFKDAGGKTDRSRMALAFATALLRAKVDKQLLASIIMDPAWVVGACVRDKGGTVKRHLKRLIERAAKFVDEDAAKPATLSRDDWTKNAERYLMRCQPDGMVHWREDFYRYQDGVWLPMEDDSVRSGLRKFLDASLVWVKDGDDGKPVFGPFKPDNGDVSELLAALRDLTHIDKDAMEQPCWLEGGDVQPPAHECMNTLNGILHIPTRKLMPHTPDFFTSSLTDYAFDPAATCPLWRKVLADYWPEAGAQEPTQLQEMMGYCSTGWTSLQKVFAVCGPGRSGKGTLGKVLKLIVGPKNSVSLALQALGGEWVGMQLVHKSLCVVTETGFGRGDNRTVVTNFLKTVSGEDDVSLNRKNKDFWSGRLPTRFWMECNKIPDFDDAGKALMMRLIPLQMTISWAGKEDEALLDKLTAELPGILNWCLEGYDRLRQNGGKWTLPQSTLDTREVFGRMSNPMQVFLEDFFTFEPEAWVLEDDIYSTYEAWCEDSGQRPMSKNRLIEAMVSTEPAKIGRLRPRVDAKGDEFPGGIRPRAVRGLRAVRTIKKRERSSASGGPDSQIPF